MNRRSFLERTVGASACLALGAVVPGFLRHTARAAAQNPSRETVLVVIQLSGGNDGLNTVVPYEEDTYHRLRPTLRLAANRVIPLSDGLGLHPEMPAFRRLYEEGRLAIIQGVGYPNSSRDHEAAMRDWHSARIDAELRNTRGVKPQKGSDQMMASSDLKGGADAGSTAQTGWVGRAIDQVYDPGQADLPGAFAGSIKTPFALQPERALVPSFRSTDAWLMPGGDVAGRPSFEQRLETLAQAATSGPGDPLLAAVRRTTADALAAGSRLRAAARAASKVDYPRFTLAQDLKTIARLIRAELGIRIFFAELGGGGIGGFDTHAGQAANHGALLRELSESVSTFLKDLEQDRRLDSVQVLTFSEFGRTVAENGRRGTDHGAAAPMLLAGGGLKQRLIGAHPSLTDLEADALKCHIDFRQVYATVLERWLGLDSAGVFGRKFPLLDGIGAG